MTTTTYHALTPPLESGQVTAVPLAGEGVAEGPTMEIRSPYDGSVIGRVPRLGAAHVSRAVDHARRHFRAGPLPPWQRARILEQAAHLLDESREQFARVIALEAAKPIRTARLEAERAAATLRFSAVEARQIAGDAIPLQSAPGADGKIAWTVPRPIGIVGAITPFNFPLNLVVHKVGPAVAAGCPVVVKPAGQTPFSAIALAQLLHAAGLPDWMLQVVTGPGSAVGAALVEHADIALISFTGSPEVGWGIRAAAPRKRVGLELGNNAPVIIAEDGDWKKAADKIRTAGFSHAGQSCISTQRVFVHSSVSDEFTAYLAQQVQTLVVGDPLAESTEVSQLISTGERDRVVEWIQEAVDNGARIAAGGAVGEDGVLAPTLLVDVTADMKVCRLEVFGPVVSVQVVDSVDEGLRLANATRYGLQAAIFTRALSTAFAAADALDFGGVLINEVPTWRADQMPYGGLRDSGNTREGPHWSVREMTEYRLVIVDYTA